MTKKTNLCVVKVKTLWGCPKNFQEHVQKEKKKQHNHKYCMFHSVSMIYRNSSLKAIAEKVNKFCTPILTMEEPRSFYCYIFLQERYRRIPFDMELLLEGFLVLCGLKQGVGLAVPLWLIDLAATTALLTPTGVTPAETRAVAAVGALSDLLSRPLSIWKSIRCYRDIRKALLYLFPSRGYGNDNNYVKVNTESKMSYTLRTGWSFSVCLIPNAGSHSSESTDGGRWVALRALSTQPQDIPSWIMSPTTQLHTAPLEIPTTPSLFHSISLLPSALWAQVLGLFLCAQTPHQQLNTTLTIPPLHSALR